MKKEQTPKKSPNLKLWLSIGGSVVLLILVVILIIGNRGEQKNKDWAPVIPGENQVNIESTGETFLGGEGEGETNGENTTVQSEDTSHNGNVAESSPVSENPAEITTDDTQSNTPSDTQSNATEGTTPIPTLGDEDPYEDWLAAAMVIGISMEYTEFDFLGIYIASETPVAAHDSSLGAYVIFEGDGERLALKSVPIQEERQEKGVKDLYVPALGYATYDLVDADSISGGNLKVRTIEDLEELIIGSSQVTIVE